MHLPGIAPRVVNQPAVLLDLAPTLASYLDLPFQQSWQGHDWLRETPPTRQVVTHTEPVDNWGGLGLPEKLALVEGRYKLVYNLSANDVQLFDLDVDPGEHHSIALSNPEIVKALSTSLAQWQDRADCRR
jgi:arylsulfatase A-like enzyme